MNSRATTGKDDRLVDYFAVVGLGTDLEPIDNMTGMPIETADGTPPRDMTFRCVFSLRACFPVPTSPLTHRVRRAETRHRFPLVDYDAPPYPTGVGLFCFPDGLKLSFGYPPMPTFFTFVATGGTGTKLYACVPWSRVCVLPRRVFHAACLARSHPCSRDAGAWAYW